MVRLVGAGLLFVLLLYWTVSRLVGDDEDPALRLSKRSETGAFSGLVSGFYAVAAVAIAAILLLWREVMATPQLGLVFFAIVLGHFVIEAQEAG
jgi:hypothetical protein